MQKIVDKISIQIFLLQLNLNARGSCSQVGTYKDSKNQKNMLFNSKYDFLPFKKNKILLVLAYYTISDNAWKSCFCFVIIIMAYSINSMLICLG